MTVVTPEEAKQCDIDLVSYCAKYPDMAADMVGLAVLEKGAQRSWYAVMYSPWASKFRSNFGLPHREFHVTLGFYGEDLYGSGSLFHCIKSSWTECDASLQLVHRVIEDTCAQEIPQVELDEKLFILRRASESFIVRGASLLAGQIKVLRNIANWCVHVCFKDSIDLVLDIGYCLFHRGIPYGLHLVLLARSDVWEACRLEGQVPQGVLSGAKFEIMAPVLRDCNVLIAQRSKAAQRNGAGTVWSYYDPVFALDPKEKCIELVKVPRNFSWVTLERPDLEARLQPYLLAGSAYPTTRKQLVALRNVGIQHILTVHEAALPASLCPTIALSAKSTAFDLGNYRESDDLGIVSYHFDVVDRTPPAREQLEAMCAIIHKALSRSEGVLVHCQGGVGRTNTVIIAYLMWSQHLSAADATAQVTEQRKIILSQSQKMCLQRWWSVCVEDREARVATALETAEAQPEKTPLQEMPVQLASEKEPSTVRNAAVPMYRSIASALKLPQLIVLCGYAASGKSTFAQALASASPFFVRINKDEMRGKGECENTLFDAITAINANAKKVGGRPGRAVETIRINPVSPEAGAVVIDCCNLSAAKRSDWCKLAHSPRAWCVYFNIPLEQCKERIQSRRGHPTILSGEAGVRILGSMQRMMEPPSVASARKEGFERLIVVNNEQEVADLMSSWKIPFPSPTSCAPAEAEPAVMETNDDLLKFPRTSHIMNLGAATRDDKILGETDLAALLGRKHTVVVEEKLDGANMGIFIHSQEHKIMVQNRSHFISSKYHAQFGPLDHWLEQHSADLWTILTPGRHILYGEWLHATHSVKYTHLPGWFVAYDLYDRTTGTFASRAVLAELLATTSIPHVPLIYEGSIDTVEDLKSMIHGTSKYNRTQREGIVARVCKDGKLVSRAKLVRADFIAGNERWNKSFKLETNTLSTEN